MQRKSRGSSNYICLGCLRCRLADVKFVTVRNVDLSYSEPDHAITAWRTKPIEWWVWEYSQEFTKLCFQAWVRKGQSKRPSQGACDGSVESRCRDDVARAPESQPTEIEERNAELKQLKQSEAIIQTFSEPMRVESDQLEKLQDVEEGRAGCIAGSLSELSFIRDW